jgi:methyltransferase (TIGR00027 family)
VKPGEASRTAVMVCMGRAIAHGRTSVARYEDPVAISLLPDDARERAERIRSNGPAGSLRERLGRMHIRRLSRAMVARTVAIDDAIREALAPQTQLVILGAGLDGRAWRMRELAGHIVFEVDHPDTQGNKRARTASLARTAEEVRFVPVDFERDSLDDALARAGHDPARPTIWVWEGVVMYLALPDIEATLAVVQRRSAPASRMVVVYHRPALLLRLLGFVVARLGEPLRSSFEEEAMRALLRKHAFVLVRDESIAAIGARLGGDVVRSTKPISHLRVATADRHAYSSPRDAAWR